MNEVLEPITRKEMFLAKIAGNDVETPEPVTREEMFLAKIAAGGGSGGNDGAGTDGGGGSGGSGGNAVPPLVGTTDEVTPTEVMAALAEGRPVIISAEEGENGAVFNNFQAVVNMDSATVVSTIIVPVTLQEQTYHVTVTLMGSIPGNQWNLIQEDITEGGSISVTGATVGQTVKIASVDETGKPTAWEPVDFPSGGGGGKWELIATGTITEDVTYFDISEDMNGKAFKLSRAYIAVKIEVPSNSVNKYVTTQYNGKVVCNNAGSSSPADSVLYYQSIGKIHGGAASVAHSLSGTAYNHDLNISNNMPFWNPNTWKGQDHIYSVGIKAGNGQPNQIGANTIYELYGVRV